MYTSHEPDELMPYGDCDACDAHGQCDEHIDPFSDEFDYDDPYDVVMYDLDVEEDDLYALIDMLGDTTRSWYARRRLNALAASGPLRALVADIIIDSLGRRWNPLEHPRDRFGRFINTGGFFRWLGRNGKWLRGRVERIDSDGVIHARSVGNDRLPDGQLVRFKPEQSAKLVSVADPLADLDAGPEFQQKFALDLDADIPDFPEASTVQKRVYNALRNGNMPAEDIDRFFVSSDELSPADFAAELEGLRERGLVEIDNSGTRPRVQRTDLDQLDGETEITEVLDVPEDEVPELEDSPALTKEQRELLDFITDIDRGEGDGVAFEELDEAAEEDIQALIDAGALDDADGRLHLVNPEEGISDLNAPEVPPSEPDLFGEILEASEVLDDPLAQEAFQHFAMKLAQPDNEDVPLPEGLAAGKRRNAEQAANRWWTERNGETETPDPNEAPEGPNPQDILNPRNQALADTLAAEWLDEEILDEIEGEEYRAALKHLFDAADYEENGFDKLAGVERFRAERGFNRINVPQEDIDGWPDLVQEMRERGSEEIVPEPDVVPEEIADEAGEAVDEVEDVADVAEDVVDEAAPVELVERPAFALFVRRDPAHQRLVEEDASEYEWGAVAAEKDIAAGLPPMSDADHGNLWGGDSGYAEGYRDAYADNEQFNVTPEGEGVDEVVPDADVVPQGDDAAPDVTPIPTNDELAQAVESGEFTGVDADVDRVFADLDTWLDWQRRVRDGRDPNGDLNDELIREKAVADELGLDLFSGGGLLSWSSFMKDYDIDGPAAEELYRRLNGDVDRAAMERFMNRDAVPEADLPEADFVPSPSAVPIADVPEHAAINNQKPFNIDDYPYITDDGKGLANRQGRLVEIGNWYRANRGGEGDPDEVVGFYDQDKFPGWVLVRAPDGKLKGAHVLGQGKTGLGGLNHRAEPPGNNPGEIAGWRAQRAARGGNRLDDLDQNNPANLLRGPNGRGKPGGQMAEVGMAVHYLGGGKKFGPDNNGVISRIGWNEGLQQPIIHVLVPGRDGGKPVEVAIAPEMLELRRDPVTVRTPPTPDVLEVPGAPVLPDREWQIPTDNELIDRMDEAVGPDGFIDYVGFVNAFVNPGVVADQIDALVDAGDRRFVRGAGPNGRPALRMLGRDEMNAPEVALPDGAENAAEGNILNALDNAGSAGLPRGGLVDIEADDVTDQLDALRELQNRNVIERADGPDGKPIFRRVDPGPEFADGAENEVEGGLLEIIDGLDRDARVSDLMDADADDLDDKLAALRALVDRGVLKRVAGADGRPVYRRPPTNSGSPTPMSDEEAQSALRDGVDPFLVANPELSKALKAAGFQFVPNGEAAAAGAISPNNWVIAPYSGEFPVNLRNQGEVDGRVYMVKRSSGQIPNDMLNEVMSGVISEDLRVKLGQDAAGLLYHPRVGVAQAPIGVGAGAGGAIIMDHVAYGYPQGHQFYSGHLVSDNELKAGNALDSVLGLALYDYVINNASDRHRNNQMYVKDPNTGEIRAVVIDNGFAFGAGEVPRDFRAYSKFYKPNLLLQRAQSRARERADVERAVRDFAVTYQNIDVDSIMERLKNAFPGMTADQEDYARQWIETAASRANEIALDIDGIVDILMNI